MPIVVHFQSNFIDRYQLPHIRLVHTDTVQRLYELHANREAGELKFASGNPAISLISSIAFVLLLVFALRGLNLDDQLMNMLLRVEQAGAYGAFVFMIVVSLFVVFMLPSVLLTLGSGALYGVFLGSLAIVTAETIGATLAFFLGRSVLRDSLIARLSNWPKLNKTLYILREHDWQLVAMLRMIPFFPFKISNYMLGVTPVSAKAYFSGTFIGLWPISLFNVYLGSLAGDLMSLDQSDRLQTPVQWAIAITGLLLSGVVAVLAFRRASSALSQVNSNTSIED